MAASIANSSAKRLPTVFVNHGGGPMPLLGEEGHAQLTKYMKDFRFTVPKPKALLVISAHWEESVVTISNGANPKMIFDYYGFPAESYKFNYSAPGSPSLAQHAAGLLQNAGIPVVQADRGYDHGTFVPLMLMFPDADIPVVQVSLHHSLDPKMHLDIGEALLPLRDEGVLIIGSGLSFHNMRVFQTRMGGRIGGGKAYGKAFKQYLTEACTHPDASSRSQLLSKWKTAPGGLEAHPREEHLIPLMVVSGAAGTDPGRVVFEQENFMGSAVAGFMFGQDTSQAAAAQNEL